MRRPNQVVSTLAACSCCALGLIGLLTGAPEVVCVLVLGLGQGAALALALTFFAVRAPNAAVTTQLSGMAQTGGYLFAALGPVLTGALHDLSGGWSLPLVLLILLVLLQTVFGGLVGRARIVGETTGR
jgi:CP family cyanate transporter-like MFS transporter